MTRHIEIYPVRVIFIILTISCMVVIFMFSRDNAGKSSKKSGRVTEAAVETFVRDYDKLPPAKQNSIRDKAEHIIRKLAHYSIYMSLGFCASMAVGRRRLRSRKNAGVLAFCFLYACSDEIHQHFVPGRACMFTDVLIDTGGAITGMVISLVLLALAGFIRRKRGGSGGSKPAAADAPLT